jgi:hypothetical protein
MEIKLDGSEWLASHSGSFTLGEIISGTHEIGDWVGPRAGVDVVSKRNIPIPSRNQTLIVQLVVCCFTDSDLLFCLIQRFMVFSQGDYSRLIYKN